MKLVHMADLHLGFKGGSRYAADGRNQRECDVHESFDKVIDMTIALAPDLVVVAGDLFHVVQPRNTVVLRAFDQFRRMVSALPGTIFVAVAGNHDQPKSRDQTAIMNILSRVGVHVVDRHPKRLVFADRALAVMCVPETDALDDPLAPDPSAKYNVLLVHGEVSGIIKGSRAAFTYDKTDLAEAGWDYVALGHYHDYTEVAPRVFYSGAIDHTTSDVWHEDHEKGIIEFNLDTHEHAFRPIAGLRPHIDLPVIDAGAIAETSLILDQMRASVAAIGGAEGKVIRQVVTNFTRERAKDIPKKALAEFVTAALDFQFVPRKPEREEVVRVGMSIAKQGTLRDRLNQYMGEERPIDPDIDREALIALGMQYFDQTADLMMPTQEKIENVA